MQLSFSIIRSIVNISPGNVIPFVIRTSIWIWFSFNFFQTKIIYFITAINCVATSNLFIVWHRRFRWCWHRHSGIDKDVVRVYFKFSCFFRVQSQKQNWVYRQFLPRKTALGDIIYLTICFRYISNMGLLHMHLFFFWFNIEITIG